MRAFGSASIIERDQHEIALHTQLPSAREQVLGKQLHLNPYGDLPYPTYARHPRDELPLLDWSMKVL